METTRSWAEIAQFDLDAPISEYGFSTRLASDNDWTRNFTALAILEYKKFMYLAATTNGMVSPSPMVDVVWHAHLIFTQSYTAFCKVLGKEIHHIPSTHNRAEASKFKDAWTRTQQRYREVFGEPPALIWEAKDMMSSVGLPKAGITQTAFFKGLFVLYVILFWPLFTLLKPYYLHIGNPGFLLSYILLSGTAMLGLYGWSRWQWQRVLKATPPLSVIQGLQSLELLYMRRERLAFPIHAVMNRLVDQEKVDVCTDYSVRLNGSPVGESAEEHTVIEAVRVATQPFHYPALIYEVSAKPAFTHLKKSMDKLIKYIQQSPPIANVFYLNVILLALIQMLGTVRLVLGIMRDKPVGFLAVCMVGLTVAFILYLRYMNRYATRKSIPGFFAEALLPVREGIDADIEWQYFLLGDAVLVGSFVPLVAYVERHNRGTFFSGGLGSGTCGTSCGSSCGSSCSSGSSCGSACGGGCGGCGGGD